MYSLLPTEIVIDILSYVDIKLPAEKKRRAILLLYGRRRCVNQNEPQLLFRTVRVHASYLIHRHHLLPDKHGCLYLIEHDDLFAAATGMTRSANETLVDKAAKIYNDLYCERLSQWKCCRYWLICADETVPRSRFSLSLPIYEACIGLSVPREYNYAYRFDRAHTCLDHLTHVSTVEHETNPFYLLHGTFSSLRYLHILWDTRDDVDKNVSVSPSPPPSLAENRDDNGGGDDCHKPWLHRWIAYTERLFVMCPCLQRMEIDLKYENVGDLMESLLNKEWCLPPHVHLYVGVQGIYMFAFLRWALYLSDHNITFYDNDRSYGDLNFASSLFISFPNTRFRIMWSLLAQDVYNSNVGWGTWVRPMIVHHDDPLVSAISSLPQQQQQMDMITTPQLSSYCSEFVSSEQFKGVHITLYRSHWLKHLDQRITIKCVVQATKAHKKSTEPLFKNLSPFASPHIKNHLLVPVIVTVNNDQEWSVSWPWSASLDSMDSIFVPIALSKGWSVCSTELRLILDHRFIIHKSAGPSLCNASIYRCVTDVQKKW